MGGEVGELRGVFREMAVARRDTRISDQAFAFDAQDGRSCETRAEGTVHQG